MAKSLIFVRPSSSLTSLSARSSLFRNPLTYLPTSPSYLLYYKYLTYLTYSRGRADRARVEWWFVEQTLA